MEGGGECARGTRDLNAALAALSARAPVQATANVDMETDALIQRTLRENFEDALVLTVAHRINTVIESVVSALWEEGGGWLRCCLVRLFAIFA